MKCKQCDNCFEPKQSNQIFCSSDCCKIWYKLKLKHGGQQQIFNKVCKRCGRVFECKIVHQVFCSSRCSSVYWKESFGKSNSLPITIKCKHCDKEFIKKSSKINQVFCSKACCNAFWKEKKITDYTKTFTSCVRSCRFCGNEFQATQANHFFCSEQCRLESYKYPNATEDEDIVQLKNSKHPRGRYVYAWFKEDELFPFYIGKGVGDRAWKYHKVGDRPAFCQSVKSSAKSFRCEIVRDNLTAEGSLLVEAVLMDFVIKCTSKSVLTNQTESMKRQEKGCLILDYNEKT